MNAPQLRTPKLVLRIAGMLVGGQTVLAVGVSTLLLLAPLGGGSFPITNSIEVTLIYGLATTAIAVSGGATVVGLWRGRHWATVAALIEEGAWAVVLLGGVLGPLDAAPMMLLVSPAVLVGLILASSLRRRPETIP